MHYRIIWQHTGDLRGVALFQNANGHEYIYPESGGGRRVLPDWNTLSAVHNANLQLAIRGVYVQSLHGEHIHHLLHLVDFPAHHVRGSIYSGMPPDFLATISNSAYCQSGLSDCLVNFSGPHAARDPLCQHCGAGGWHQLLVQHNVARCVQEAFGHHLHTVHIFPRIRHTAVLYPEFLLLGYKETAIGGSQTRNEVQGEEAGSQEGHSTGTDGNNAEIISSIHL